MKWSGKWVVMCLVGVMVALGMVGAAQVPLPFTETFEGAVHPNLPRDPDWRRDPDPPKSAEAVCWKVVDKIANLWGEPESVRAFPSGTRAAYFGKVDPSTGKGSYADERNQVKGDLYSPSIAVTAGDYVKISFWFLRLVEHYTGGEYDVTEVECIWATPAPPAPLPTKLWRKTSKDPSAPGWAKFESDPIEVPTGVTGLAIRFRFDSKDGDSNNYLGWLIDDVKVERVPPPLRITTADLPEGEVGRAYGPVNLAASGGRPPYKWSLAAGYELPRRLALSEGGGLSGTPEVPGAFYVEFVVKDSATPANTASKGFWIRINPKGAHVTFTEDFSGAVRPGLPSGWEKTPDSLWHTTNAVTGVSSPPPTPWAYYGKDGNYDTGRRTWGYLTSPQWDITAYRGSKVVVEFRYWREVESYDKGVYDKTYVEIRFDDGDWIKIWQKDSTDPSERAWTLAVIDKDVKGNEIFIPAQANKIQIRFGFDSVDGHNNRYVGWLIDDVKIRCVPDVLRIVTTRLPTAEVGAPYKAKFEARGGMPPYTWEADTRLPRGLDLNRNTGEIRGVPQVDPGEYKFNVTVTDRDGTKAGPKEFTLVVGRRLTLFFEDFEEGLGQRWTTEDLGLWHHTALVKDVNLVDRGNVAYYGQHDATNPNYATGARTVGYLTSKEFYLDGAANFKLTFDYWREVEYYAAGGYDKTYVQVRFLKAGTWSAWRTIWSRDSANPAEKTWTLATLGPYKVDPEGSTKMQIRFVFDSVDRYYNNYVGWLVDNVRVAKETSGAALPNLALPLTLPREEFTVFNYPNPVRDVHTTTFAVRGVEAELLRVEIYDLTGKLVWKGEAQGNELTWHTQDLSGLPLANGVYLYKVYVKVGETWIVSKVLKLVILR